MIFAYFLLFEYYFRYVRPCVIPEHPALCYLYIQYKIHSALGDNRKCQYGYCFQFGVLSGMFINICRNI